MPSTHFDLSKCPLRVEQASTSRASVHVRSAHLNSCIGYNQCHGSSVFRTCVINVVVFVVLWYIECCGRVHRILQARTQATVGRCYLRPHERKPSCNATIGVERAWTMQAEAFERGIWHPKNVSSREAEQCNSRFATTSTFLENGEPAFQAAFGCGILRLPPPRHRDYYVRRPRVATIAPTYYEH